MWIRGGTYLVSRTFRLTAEDSGAVYQAYRNETVRLIGGRPIRGFRRVTDRRRFAIGLIPPRAARWSLSI